MVSPLLCKTRSLGYSKRNPQLTWVWPQLLSKSSVRTVAITRPQNQWMEKELEMNSVWLYVDRTADSIPDSGGTKPSPSHRHPFVTQTTLNHALSSWQNIFSLYESAWDAELEKLCNEKSPTSRLILSLFQPFFSQFWLVPLPIWRIFYD